MTPAVEGALRFARGFCLCFQILSRKDSCDRLLGGRIQLRLRLMRHKPAAIVVVENGAIELGSVEIYLDDPGLPESVSLRFVPWFSWT